MTNIQQVSFSGKEQKNTPQPDENLVSELATAISSWFVRRDGKFYAVDNLGAALSKPDVQRVCLHRLQQRYPKVELTNELMRRTFARAIDARTALAEQSIAVWSGKRVCRPGFDGRLIWEDGLVAVNTWVKPAYREIDAEPQLGIAGEFFETIFPSEIERAKFLDWLAWCLQNEQDKPSWAPFLYSRTKGSGKSTLCQLAIKLFGEDNAITQNSVDKLTSRFNMTILQSKLVVSEELQLRPDSAQGNTLKTYITEKATLSEQKGREAERIEQSCCFIFTTNHLPIWIEAEDRRYYVIEIDHQGHAAGPNADAFAKLVGKLHVFMDDQKSLAGLYRFLMARELQDGFNAKSLNVVTDATDVMRRIQGASRQTSLDHLEELLNEERKNAISEESVVQLMAGTIRGSINATKHLMAELEWTKTKVKWGGVDYARAIWVRKGYAVADGRLYASDGSYVSLQQHLDGGSRTAKVDIEL